MGEKSADKRNEPLKNGQQEGSHERGINPAEKIREALGNLAAKL